MQKPPGVGNPACVSTAKFAALGPTRSGSVALRSLSGRMNEDTLIFSNSSPNIFPPPLAGEGREGASGLLDRCGRPPPGALRAPTLPRKRERGEIISHDRR